MPDEYLFSLIPYANAKVFSSPIIAFEKWQAWAEEKACCDFAFKMRIPTPLNEDLEDQMRELSTENNINCFLASMEDFNDADLIKFYQARKQNHFCTVWYFGGLS